MPQELPALTVGIRKYEPYKPLTRMAIANLRQEQALMRVTLGSEDGMVFFHFYLDFEKERLHFDISDGIFVVPDDESAAFAENQAELARFFKEYVGNGQLQFFNADTGALLSRKDAFLPLNCWLDVDGANANIERWQKLQAGRNAAVVPAPAGTQ